MSLESIDVWPQTPQVSSRAVSAAQTLRSYVWTKGGAKKDRELKALAEKVPGCKWSDYLRLHLFYRTDWGDGTSPSIGTVASFQGCQQAIDNAMLLMTSLRAEQQAIASVERKVTTLYRVVVALEHVSSHSLVAWLDVETGLVDPHGRPWLEAEEKRLAANDVPEVPAQVPAEPYILHLHEDEGDVIPDEPCDFTVEGGRREVIAACHDDSAATGQKWDYSILCAKKKLSWRVWRIQKGIMS